jgi:hypothetical protein
MLYRNVVLLFLLTFSVSSFGQNLKFGSKTFNEQGQEPQAQGDLNGDGILDILAPGHSETLDKNGFEVILSNPDGTYQASSFYTSAYPGNPNVVTLGDFNGDGKVDVAEVESTHDYYIYLNSGTGTLRPSWNFATQAGLVNDQIATADFNHDGKLDLILSASGNGFLQFEILLGRGDGTFAAPVIFDPNAKGGRLLIGDFDSDGNADLASTFGNCDRGIGCFTNIRVYYGDGKGAFSSPIAIDYSDDYNAWISNDIDQDGHSDLIGSSGQSVAQPVVRILHGTSARTFAVQDVPLAMMLPQFTSFDVADFDGDGNKDIAVREDFNGRAALGILLAQAGGTYAPEQYVHRDSNDLRSILAGRYNADTKPDLLATVTLGGTGGTLYEFLRNHTVGNFPACAPPKAPKGIQICAPKNGSRVLSPVAFHVGAAFTSPLRKTEVWIDGVKRQESFNSDATYSFLDGTFSLSPGPHRADIYSASFDNLLQHVTVNFTVR